MATGNARQIAMGVPEWLIPEVIYFLELRQRGLHRSAMFEVGGESKPLPPEPQVSEHELEELCDRVETLQGAPPYVNQMGRDVWAHYKKFGRVSSNQVATLRKFLEYKTRKMTPAT